MGLDFYLDLQKRKECIDKDKLEILKKTKKTYLNAIRKNSNLADKRMKIYKENMDWELFYKSRTHKHMNTMREKWIALKTEVYDTTHKWLNTDYRLYELFNSVFNGNHKEDYYASTITDDSFEISLNDLCEVYDRYKELEDIDGQNLRMMKDVINKYTKEHYIKFSWWV